MAVHQKDCECYMSYEQLCEMVQLSILICSHLLELELSPEFLGVDKDESVE